LSELFHLRDDEFISSSTSPETREIHGQSSSKMSSKKTLSIGDKVPFIELYDDRNVLTGIPLQTGQYTVLFFYPIVTIIPKLLQYKDLAPAIDF